MLDAQNDTLNVTAYNLMNLPLHYISTAGDTVKYVYSADGEKLFVMEIPAAGYSTGTEYAANYRIENETLKMIHTDAGYYTPMMSLGGGLIYLHFWYLKDHLGNNRIVANGNGSVIEAHDYDPFGVDISVLSSGFPPFPTFPSPQGSPYKYGGKEWNTTTSTYDFEARQMSPSFHRFTTMDPLAEKYYGISPYAYCAGNPANIKDEKGLSPNYVIPIPIPVLEKMGEFIAFAIGMSILVKYVSYRASNEMAKSNNSEEWEHQKKEDRKAWDDFNQRQAKMQESIDKHFPQQNDPNREPNWNGKHKGLRTFLIVLELLHQGKDFLSKKEKEKEQEQNQNQERTPEGKNEYYFQPENSNNSEEPSHNGTNWIESLNNHMNSRLS